MELRRLYPDPAVADSADVLGDLGLAERAPSDRPYLICNFVVSADGHATFRGRSGPLGDDGDHEVFHMLRTQADAIMAGTGTLRAERYGKLIRRPERRAVRAAIGLAADPPLVTVTRSGSLAPDLPLLEDPDSTLILYTGGPVSLAGDARIEVVEVDPAALTMTHVMRDLRSRHGIRSVLCEGGPALFGALVHERLVDELFLTVAPQLAGGGEGLTVSTGPALAAVAALELVWALERNGSLFLRYRVP
jgi:riboflavin biosynthesis pyrimidine reductase